MARRVAETSVLRVVVVILGLVPVGAGVAGMLEGSAMTGGSGLGAGVAAAALDSHVRYLSGVLLAIGLGFWSTVPRIATTGPRFRLLTFLVVMGGLGRGLGVILHGLPPASMTFGLVMELAVTPLLCLWQTRVARLSGRRRFGR